MFRRARRHGTGRTPGGCRALTSGAGDRLPSPSATPPPAGAAGAFGGRRGAPRGRIADRACLRPVRNGLLPQRIRRSVVAQTRNGTLPRLADRALPSTLRDVADTLEAALPRISADLGVTAMPTTTVEVWTDRESFYADMAATSAAATRARPLRRGSDQYHHPRRCEPRECGQPRTGHCASLRRTPVLGTTRAGCGKPSRCTRTATSSIRGPSPTSWRGTIPPSRNSTATTAPRARSTRWAS